MKDSSVQCYEVLGKGARLIRDDLPIRVSVKIYP